MPDFGIRREDKNRWERRAPLTPGHVAELTGELGLKVAVQPSMNRIFPDDEYRAAGATIQEDLSDCHTLLCVKEIPPRLVIPGKPYFCFPHVTKGQPESMPLLRRVLEARCTLIDYERIVDRYGRRLIFFGRHAGYAGMIDALWALGQRLLAEGDDTAFACVQPSHRYQSVDDAAEFIADRVGKRIREQGVSPALHPLVCGFTGGGNVSQGAQEIFDRLPMVEVHPEELPELARDKSLSRRAVYKAVFRRGQRVDFGRHLPYLTVLVNGIYWEPGQAHLVTRNDLKALWAPPGNARLRILADITCDVGGSIAATVRATTPDDPVYVYEPDSGDVLKGVVGRGPVVLAVDNLPAEFPRDATEHFGDSLFPFLANVARADFDVPFRYLTLPAGVLAGLITHAGELAPGFRHLEHYLGEAATA